MEEERETKGQKPMRRQGSEAVEQYMIIGK